MEYKTLLSIRLQLAGKDLPVELISEHLGIQPNRWLKQEEPKLRGDLSPYKEHRCSFYLVDKKKRDPNSELSKLRGLLSKLESELLENSKNDGLNWIVVELYDPEFIQVNLERDILSFLANLGISLSIENRG